MEIINWKLASHPMNWIVILLMVFIGSIAISIVLNGLAPESKPKS